MDTSERAQQYSIEDKQCIKSEVKTLGFVTNAGYKATLQRMVSKEINDEMTTNINNNDDVCRTNRSIMVPTDNRRRGSLFKRILSSGSVRSTASTSNLSVGDNSSVSGSMTSSKSWQSFSNLLDALELLPDDDDNTKNIESINANLAPRKRSDASITKEQQDELRREIKSLSSQNDVLMRRMLCDDPRHELIPHGTKCRKNDNGIDHGTQQQQQLQVPIEVTATNEEEGELEEQFDPQAFLDDLIYGKKNVSCLDMKKPIGSADTDSKKVEPTPFPNNNRLHKADEDSENDSISLPSSNDSFKDGDDCWLSWPKLEADSDR